MAEKSQAKGFYVDFKGGGGGGWGAAAFRCFQNEKRFLKL